MISGSVETQLAEAFTHFVQCPENLNEDGSVNWDFVDADMHINLNDKVKMVGPVRYNELFNYLAASHETAQILENS